MKMSDLLTKDYMRKLDLLTVDLGKRIRSGLTGNRKALGKGNSLEFADFRNYNYGDDLRRIDWNSYARFDKLYLKLYAEEKQATVNIFLDTSASMAGSGEKERYAKLIAASIAYVYLQNSDRVNLFLVNSTVELGKKAMTSKKNFYDLVNFLDSVEFKGQADFNGAITPALQLSAGVCYVLSDFFFDSGFEVGAKTLQERKQEPILVQLLEKTEANPDLEGYLRLVDSENKSHANVVFSEDVKEKYMKALYDYRRRIKTFADSRAMGFAYADTGQYPLGVMNELFRAN